MRLADDDRARVPFALIGAVLLVTSATLAVGLAGREPGTVTSRTGAAMTEAESAARTALTDAATRAAHAAAGNPLVVPRDAGYGRVVDPNHSVRDGFRVRLLVAAREALARAGVTVDGVRASVSVPPVSGPATLRDALASLRVERVGTGRVRVHFRNLTVTATRNGRVLDSEQYATTITVRAPVLALSDRVQAFERRLNASPLDRGLGRRLLTRLTAVANVRGLAQYGGAPISNVVSNRHVELLANGAVLYVQRAVFGQSDPAGRGALHRGILQVGVRALLRGQRAVTGRWTEALLDGRPGVNAPSSVPTYNTASERRAPLRTAVNGTADAAFVALRRGDGRASLRSVLQSVYTAEARLLTRVERVDARTERGRVPPNATVVGVDRTVERSVRNATGGLPDPPGDAHRLATFARRVTVTERTTRRWQSAGASGVARRVESTVHHVGVAVVGRHAMSATAPARPIDAPHAEEAPGPFGGATFAGVRERALDRLVAGQGGRRDVAVGAVAGTIENGTTRIRVTPPDGILPWVYRDLAALRERVRNVTVTTPRRAFFAEGPTAALAAELDARRADLRDAPRTYDGVAAKARVAARGAYLAAVAERLDARTASMEGVRGHLDALVPDAALDALESLGDGRGPGEGASNGTLATAVQGTPPYLTLDAVTVASGTRTHPLVARNVNVFTVPYGDAAERIARAVLDTGRRVRLRTAGRALDAANLTLSRSENASFGADRDALRRAVDGALDGVRRRLVTALDRSDALTATESRRAVERGMARWSATDDRALAAANGSLADAVAAAAPLENATRRDWVRERLRVALAAATREPSNRPRASDVTPVARSVRTVGRNALREAARRGLESAGRRLWNRWVGDALVAVPAGLPVTPVPGYWYATVNVWRVTVGGEYARFAVTAPGAGPRRPDLTYVRRAATVAVDVDGDGRRERLGRNRPVDFRVQVPVVVVVPPGGRGVGDRGPREERSPGWPTAGPG